MDNDTTRTLVVFYSRTGTTKIVAHEIAEALKCDVEELVDRRPRDGVLGYLRSMVDMMFERSVDLAPTKLDPAAYDLVIVGTPIWGASVSAPVRTYLAARHARIKDVAFFCTHGGSGSASTLKELEELCHKAPRVSLVLRTAVVQAGDIDIKIRKFVEGVQAARRSMPVPGTATPGHAHA